VIHIAEFQVREKRIKEGSILAGKRKCRIEYLEAMSNQELQAATQLYIQSGRISEEEARLIVLCKSRNIAFLLTERSIKELCCQKGVNCLDARTIETSG